jgi:hypothetical protein
MIFLILQHCSLLLHYTVTFFITYIHEYPYVNLSFTFCIDIFHLCCIGFLYDVCLRVTMTSSTQGTITGYLPRALMDLALPRLSHMPKGTCYVQICQS